MPNITLKHKSEGAEEIQAVFLPEKGMNLISFKKGNLELIDQSTWSSFEERFAGLGALIGPHFYRRKPKVIPPTPNESLFPHIARVKAKGSQDPFSHGIARYAPWSAESSETKVRARLTGKDTWNGVPLAELEGQNFTMDFEAAVSEKGLDLSLAIVSDTDSVVGIHYYLSLPKGKGIVTSEVQDQVRINRELQPIPKEWNFDEQHRLRFDLDNEADYTFLPYPNKLSGSVLLETDEYALRTTYQSNCSENCWQLYHPKGASFVCIEPISAQDPLHPKLSVSSIQIQIELLPPQRLA
jgi:hypothetical protein